MGDNANVSNIKDLAVTRDDVSAIVADDAGYRPRMMQPGAAQRTLATLNQAVRTAAETAKDADEKSLSKDLGPSARGVLSEQGMAGFASNLQSTNQAIAGMAQKGSADLGEVINALKANGDATKDAVQALTSQLAKAHARIGALRTRVDADEDLIAALKPICESLAATQHTLERNGFVDRGSMADNLRAGRLFVNGVSFDVRTLLATILLTKQGIIVREVSGSDTIMKRLIDSDGPAVIMEPAGSVGIQASPATAGAYSLDVLTKYDPVHATHIGLWGAVPGAAGPSMQRRIMRISEVWPTLAPGSVIPSTYTAPGTGTVLTVPNVYAIPELYRETKLRMSYNLTGLVTVLAALGISSYDSLLAQLPMLFAGDIQGLLKIGGAPDIVTG
jgi:hypothetical protein